MDNHIRLLDIRKIDSVECAGEIVAWIEELGE